LIKDSDDNEAQLGDRVSDPPTQLGGDSDDGSNYGRRCGTAIETPLKLKTTEAPHKLKGGGETAEATGVERKTMS
jgi:hypothetical protein